MCVGGRVCLCVKEVNLGAHIHLVINPSSSQFWCERVDQGCILKFCFRSRWQELCVLSMCMEEGKAGGWFFESDFCLWFPSSPLRVYMVCISKSPSSCDRWGISLSLCGDVATSVPLAGREHRFPSPCTHLTSSCASAAATWPGCAQQEAGLVLSQLSWLVFT